MIRSALVLMAGLWLCSCDPERTYEQTTNVPDGQWLESNKPAYTFRIADDSLFYNLYCDLRNSNNYPFSRVFINYTLTDSTGKELKKEMLSAYLFNPRDGSPTGHSGIGDIFSHRLILLKDFHFPFSGSYTMTFEHQMRLDTLAGIISVGLRVERATAAGKTR